MIWIESHTTVGRHRKTKRLARRLQTSIPAAVGHLHLLWHWAIEYAPDGDLSRCDAEDLTDACMWDGDPTELLAALVETGWLEDSPLRLHDWDEYAGRLLAARQRRREAGRKGAEVRWGRHGGAMAEASGSDSHVNAQPVAEVWGTNSQANAQPVARNSTEPSPYRPTDYTNPRLAKAIESLTPDFDASDLDAAAKEITPRIDAGEVRSVPGLLRKVAQRHERERLARERTENHAAAVESCQLCDDSGRLNGEDGGALVPVVWCDHGGAA